MTFTFWVILSFKVTIQLLRYDVLFRYCKTTLQYSIIKCICLAATASRLNRICIYLILRWSTPQKTILGQRRNQSSLINLVILSWRSFWIRSKLKQFKVSLCKNVNSLYETSSRLNRWTDANHFWYIVVHWPGLGLYNWRISVGNVFKNIIFHNTPHNVVRMRTKLGM